MLNIDLSNVKPAGEFDRLPPDGYVCRITSVRDDKQKSGIVAEFDIAYGEHTGYFKNLYDAHGFWGGSFFKSYKPKALGFFKTFVDAVEASNAGYKFNNDETQLAGKVVGLVLGEEEYLSKAGEIRTRHYVYDIKPAEEIAKGNFVVPALKPYQPKPQTSAGISSVYGSEKDSLPWGI